MIDRPAVRCDRLPRIDGFDIDSLLLTIEGGFMRSARCFLCAGIFLIIIFQLINSVCLAQPDIGPEGDPSEFGYSLNATSRGSADRIRMRSYGRPTIYAENDQSTIETVLVVNDVLVLDSKDRPVDGLKKSDFTIFENGQKQEIAFFENGIDSSAIPRSIVLLIDHSQSQLPYLKNSIEAAKILISKLPEKDRMAIVTDDVKVLVNFTSDKKLLADSLDRLLERTIAGEIGKSQQFRSLMAVVNEIFTSEDLRPIVIFQTDGDEFPALKQRYMVGPSGLRFSFDDIVKAAEKRGITIYSVIPSSSFLGLSGKEKKERATMDLRESGRLWAEIRNKPFAVAKKGYPERYLNMWAESRARDESALVRLAKATGGWCENMSSPEQAGETYERILSSINQRYMIGYYPIDQANDGSSRKIKVKISGDSDYTVWGRKEVTLSVRSSAP